jgi:hypothetical protein
VIYRSCRLRRFGVGLVVVLAGLVACSIAKAVSSVSLQWTPNTDPSVSGYRVYYGGDSRGYTNVLNAGSLTNASVEGLEEGKTYYFAVTAYDDFGDESDYSVETVYIVPGYLTMTMGPNPGDLLRVRFPVAPAHWYELQMSQDMQHWSTTWEVLGTSNQWVEFAAPTGKLPAQFFRVVLH